MFFLVFKDNLVNFLILFITLNFIQNDIKKRNIKLSMIHISVSFTKITYSGIRSIISKSCKY